MTKYDFYLSCIKTIEDAHVEHGLIDDNQWYSLMNKVLDCVYEEIKSSSPVFATLDCRVPYEYGELPILYNDKTSVCKQAKASF